MSLPPRQLEQMTVAFLVRPREPQQHVSVRQSRFRMLVHGYAHDLTPQELARQLQETTVGSLSSDVPDSLISTLERWPER